MLARAKTMLALLPLLLLGAACAEPVNLHGGNWDELVVSSGRNAFVKFYAPWYACWPWPECLLMLNLPAAIHVGAKPPRLARSRRSWGFLPIRTRRWRPPDPEAFGGG